MPRLNEPAYHAFRVDDDPSGKSRWTEIGAVWEHEDGKGFDLRLYEATDQTRIVLREPLPSKPRERERKAKDLPLRGISTPWKRP
jgi:hypothetical protein